MALEYTDLDRRIWEEELDSFVPRRVFDVHAHVYQWKFNLDPAKEGGPLYELLGKRFPDAGWADLDQCDDLLFPGRDVHRLAFPYPFSPVCDFDGANRFAASEAKHDPLSAALMLVHPSMSTEYLEARIRGAGFVGFKPYRFYSGANDAASCRITDFLPERQIEVAHRLGLIIMLHLSKREGIGDGENLADLSRLTTKYPGAKWILAHCARCYSARNIERAAPRLRQLTNVWYDTSSVCESEAIEALMAGIGPDRVMYGSDDLPVGAARGKYIVFAHAWCCLSENNHAFDLSHCDPRMTFVRYEQLRATRRAALRLNLDRRQIENHFHDTAARLIESARAASSGSSVD
ncbi:MAG: amidohydrolase family protein [Pirellulaceae bacterium]|nr:amidohydrolase family protein [Pirellulaceae bacterium]